MLEAISSGKFALASSKRWVGSRNAARSEPGGVWERGSEVRLLLDPVRTLLVIAAEGLDLQALLLDQGAADEAPDGMGLRAASLFPGIGPVSGDSAEFLLVWECRAIRANLVRIRAPDVVLAVDFKFFQRFFKAFQTGLFGPADPFIARRPQAERARNV
jgi:hypothetical protein